MLTSTKGGAPDSAAERAVRKTAVIRLNSVSYAASASGITVRSLTSSMPSS
jgi:hypothetical protein